MSREARIFQVEQHGSESCELSTNSSFVRVRVPVRIEGEGASGEATVITASALFPAATARYPCAKASRSLCAFVSPWSSFFPASDWLWKSLPAVRLAAEGSMGQTLGGRPGKARPAP